MQKRRIGAVASFNSRGPELTTSLCDYIRMPRYHFHLVDGVEVFDSLGATFPSDEAARVHAEQMAGRFTRTEVYGLRANAIRVTSEAGAVLFRIPIRHDVRRHG
jgi:hypothetical protein